MDLKVFCFLSSQAADGNMKTLRKVIYDMRRGDVLEILDEGRQDSGFDSGFGSQSLSISRSEGEQMKSLERVESHVAHEKLKNQSVFLLTGIYFFLL